MTIGRERLRFECPAADVSHRVTIEGECALAGSMRDAVTVLSVQAQATLSGVQPLSDRIAVRGRVCFQVLYTQGDLTRIRSIETTCDFTHDLPAPGAAAGMRVDAHASVLDTNGRAGSGRMALEAELSISAQAYECREMEAAAQIDGVMGLCVRRQQISTCVTQVLGEETSLVREEFDLPARLQVDHVLTATGNAIVTDITGGSGRVGVSGTVEVRVLHQAEKAGEPLVETTHEMPFQVTLGAQCAADGTLSAAAEVTDVVADSVLADKQRTMRVEAEIRVRLIEQRGAKADVLEDLYSTQGPAIVPQTETVRICACPQEAQARESVRIQVALPENAPPMETVLAAFAQPVLSSAGSSGRRLSAEGVMGVTLVYLPVDSDIPYAVRTREPFSMTFPLEAGENVRARLQAVECSVGPATSDRAELRCVLQMHARQQDAQRVRLVTDVQESPEEMHERGFVLVWPAPGESRWDTSRRLRVPQESLKPAGKNALMAFRR